MNYHDLENPAPGTWTFPTNPQICCIYRVPNRMRHVNPEAYTPQLVLIGPLNHPLKSQALRSRGNIKNAKSMAYLNTEAHKQIYQEQFVQRVGEDDVIERYRDLIEDDIERIKESYSESMDWIEEVAFVDMILEDAVFILEFLWRTYEEGLERSGDPLMDEPCLKNTIKRDLVLLENQLPYFILERLFNSIVNPIHRRHQLFRAFITTYFGVGEIREDYNIQHFTDLFRRARVETLPGHDGEMDADPMQHMYSANKLENGGVKLTATVQDFSLEVNFADGCLNIPRFSLDSDTEVMLRNIMALEQCLYPRRAYVCNYIIFLDHLIDTMKDVDLLVKKGIIRNRIGDHGLVAKVLNKLCSGVVEYGSCYSGVATNIINHYVDPEMMSHDTDLELCMSPGMWRPRSLVNVQNCCIYSVPSRLREVNPEAYTPQLVLIGPLYHSLKRQARMVRGDITNSKLLGYLNMEVQKRIYQGKFIQRFHGQNNPIDEFRAMITEKEVAIRESYSESTAWIKRPEFVEMILQDSVFILELFLKDSEIKRIHPRDRIAKTGDPLWDECSHQRTIKADLLLLENQLPYFILNGLFGIISRRLPPFAINQALRGLTISYFGVMPEAIDNSEFLHFTDLLRCIQERTLANEQKGFHPDIIEHMYNADKLHSWGVKFRGVVNESSLVVTFEDGGLTLPRFSFERYTEAKFRNIMALEQCHYPRRAYVCNYFVFLDHLIDSEKDVDLLVEKGIIRNHSGHNGLVAEFMNKICRGVVHYGTYYAPIARDVTNLCDLNINSPCFNLKRDYFPNRWRMTATLAAIAILLLTAGQLIVAIIETCTK